eukprot:UC4_evm1s330
MLVIFLLVTQETRAGIEPQTQPVADVLTRVIGVKAASIFELKIDGSMEQGFTLDNCRGNCNNAIITVTASDLPELAYGASYYLRSYANMNFAWQNTGGFQNRPPPDGWPKLAESLSLKKKVKWSYYQNVCTQSYSMWFWSWERWEQEIDWAVLWGVNLMLAYTGQEMIFKHVYNDIGINDSVIGHTFDGPAFLTWSRGQGTFGFGGPLPSSWMKSQYDLQVKIMNRLRELHIFGILPGFQGNVPKELKEIFPSANTSNGWLDALDPMFKNIAHSFNKESQEAFGPASFIEADGWFSLETGPWLSNSINDSDACLGGFVVPSEKEAALRVAKVYESLSTANPDNVWVYQGYPWFRVYSACPNKRYQLRQFVKGFASAIPQDKALILDLVADDPVNALWRYPQSDELGPFTQNLSLIWCALSNWGGAVHVGGDLSLVLSESREAMKTAHVVGTGLTPEGIDSNAAYFSLVLDAPWTEKSTARDWLADWGKSRCGAEVPEALAAYDLIYETLYKPGTPYLWCCSKPVYCPTVYPGQAVDRANYNVSILKEALELMTVAAAKCDTEAFRYDLVDIARVWLSYGPCVERLDAIDIKSPPSQLNESTYAFLEVTSDVDKVLKTNKGFLVGPWLQGSRSVAEWDGSNSSTRNGNRTMADFYEWNGRVQISTWAGGYSRRAWSGMINGYYQQRTKIWLNRTLSDANIMQSTFALSQELNYTEYGDFDCNFNDIAKHSCAGKSPGDGIVMLERLCNADMHCVGFNYPGCILKKACP